MFKVTISGKVDGDEEYAKEILAQGNDPYKSVADVNDPLTAAELLLDACNTHPISVSVEKI